MWKWMDDKASAKREQLFLDYPVGRRHNDRFGEDIFIRMSQHIRWFFSKMSGVGIFNDTALLNIRKCECFDLNLNLLCFQNSPIENLPLELRGSSIGTSCSCSDILDFCSTFKIGDLNIRVVLAGVGQNFDTTVFGLQRF